MYQKKKKPIALKQTSQLNLYSVDEFDLDTPFSILSILHFHWQKFFIINELKTLSSLLHAPHKCTMLDKRTI